MCGEEELYQHLLTKPATAQSLSLVIHASKQATWNCKIKFIVSLLN